MTAYLARRLAGCLLVLVVVSAVTFTIFFGVPGRPAELIAGKYATRETVALIEKRLGLDQPKPLQFTNASFTSTYFWSLIRTITLRIGLDWKAALNSASLVVKASVRSATRRSND